MRQAWHIFQKDVRYLWREILLVVTLAAVLARNPGVQWAGPLLIAAAGYLIARVILAEVIPGNNQFWITRPYRWSSLLTAKFLFVLAFVNLPIFLAQLYMLRLSGLSLVSNVYGLLWSQLLDFFSVWLSIGALAAMSSGIVAFIFSALLTVTAGFIASAWMIGGHSPAPQWPAGVEWIRNSVSVVAVLATTLAVLGMQYKNRRTNFSRAFAVGGIAVAAVAYICLPVSWGMGLQEKFSRQTSDPASLEIAVDPSAGRHLPFIDASGETISVDLPLMVSGIPEGIDLQVDAIALTFQGSDGRMWKKTLANTNRQSSGPGTVVFDAPLLMDASFFSAERDQPVTLRASLYLTPFGNAQAKTIPLQREPVGIVDGLQCFFARVGLFNRFTCESAFRWPPRIVYVTQGTATEALEREVSYSPFPTGITFDNLVESRSTFRVSAIQHSVTITVEQPLGHFRRDWVISDIRLAEFAAKTK